MTEPRALLVLPTIAPNPPVVWTTEDALDLTDLQNVVGGYVDGRQLWDGYWMWFNEDADHPPLPLNSAGTTLAIGFRRLGFDEYLRGPVVFTNGEDGDPLEEDFLRQVWTCLGKL